MVTIAHDLSLNGTIQQVFTNYFEKIDPKIELQEIEHQEADEDLLRIMARLNVPNTIKITNKHKNDLSKLLAVATESSIELDLNLIDIASVYIDPPIKNDTDKKITSAVTSSIEKKFPNVVVVEIKIVQHEQKIMLLTLFMQEDLELQDEEIISLVQKEVNALGEEVNVLLQWKKGITRREYKTTSPTSDNTKEIKKMLTNQFSQIFDGAVIESIQVNQKSEENIEINLEFSTNL